MSAGDDRFAPRRSTRGGGIPRYFEPTQETAFDVRFRRTVQEELERMGVPSIIKKKFPWLTVIATCFGIASPVLSVLFWVARLPTQESVDVLNKATIGTRMEINTLTDHVNRTQVDMNELKADFKELAKTVNTVLNRSRH